MVERNIFISDQMGEVNIGSDRLSATATARQSIFDRVPGRPMSIVTNIAEPIFF